ncbi:MAG: carbamate kinase [Chloroflexi bacterium]|nr:carbamate kinase [Chloroflexota bacterium]MDA1146267.1 carbamate kinase [Chloroflexota bacterium]
MRLVVAFGGNALLRRGESQEEDAQRRNIREAVRVLATLARDHDLVVTHGNGPQVGLLALASEAYREVKPYALDVLGAESQGMIGYLLAEALHDELPDRQIAPLLTQVVVDHDDPAFAHPTKFIGPVYDHTEATRLSEERGWSIAPDGDHWRRVVPSPEPRAILELPTIALLVEAGVLVICAGGGGVPVIVTPEGATHGVEAVVDKDLTAALLARQLEADALLLLTDVPAVMADWRTPSERPIRSATPEALRALEFAPGSMAPKVEAACRFAEQTGRTAYIGALLDAPSMLAGTVGTQVSVSLTG